MDKKLIEWYEKYEQDARKVMHDIWEHPEYAMEESFAAATVEAFIKKHGFETKIFNAMKPEAEDASPNTVYATWGSGKPIIGILGELDSLKGLGNAYVPYQSPIPGCGHGCGHNLMAGSSVAAAAALKHALEEEKIEGTIIFIGCPAEETLNGKVWLAKGGYFDNLDLALIWHPGGRKLQFSPHTSAALTSILFEYTGKAAHGVIAWEGRSALDACELLNIGVNYLREHITPDCSVHYVYENGGGMPNVVPEHASVFYYIRSKDENNAALVERVKNIAQAAAMMTETELKMTLRTHCYGNYPTATLNEYVAYVAKLIRPLTYEKEDYEFARQIHKNFFGDEILEDSEELLPTEIEPLSKEKLEQIPYERGSSDVGDVSQILPTLQFGGLGEITGSPAHHWTITVAAGGPIGEKAAIYCSKIIAQSALDVFKNPELLKGFWEDFENGRKKRNLAPYEKCTFEI